MAESLYGITNDMIMLQTMELDTPEDMQAFDQLVGMVEGRFEAKAEKLLKFRADLLGDAGKFREEEIRLASRRRSMENKAARLWAYLEDSIKIMGIQPGSKLEAGTFTLRLQKNPPSLKIDDQAQIPAKFLEPQPSKVRSSELKEALSDGEQIPGAHLEQGVSLRVR